MDSNLTSVSGVVEQCGRNSTTHFFHEIQIWTLVGMIPLSIIGNATIFIVVLFTRKLRHQPLYLFIVSLAVTDILITLLSITTKAKAAWDFECWSMGSWACWLVRLLEVVLFVGSTLHLLVIMLDRYLAVAYTYEYRVLVCRNTPLLLLLAVWLFAIVWGILSIFQWDAYYDYSVSSNDSYCAISNPNFFLTTYTLLYFTPIVVIAVTAVAIQRHVGYFRRYHDVMTSHIDESDTTCLVVETYNKKKESAALRSIIIVVASFTICWTPYIVFSFIYPNSQPHVERKLTILVIIIRDILPSLNSPFKPFIFVILNKTVWCSFVKVFRQMGRRTWMKKRYADLRRKRHTMPVNIADVAYNEKEDNYFEMQPVIDNAPPQRRFTL